MNPFSFTTSSCSYSTSCPPPEKRHAGKTNILRDNFKICAGFPDDIMHGPMGAGVIAGFFRLEEGVVQQDACRRVSSDDHIEFAIHGFITMVAVQEEKSLHRERSGSKHIQGNVKTVSLIKPYLGNAAHQPPTLLAGMFFVAFMVREINRMNFGVQGKRPAYLVEYSCRHPDIGSPLQDMSRPDAADSRGHKHLLVERKGVKTDLRHKTLNHKL